MFDFLRWLCYYGGWGWFPGVGLAGLDLVVCRFLVRGGLPYGLGWFPGCWWFGLLMVVWVCGWAVWASFWLGFRVWAL